MAMTYQNFASLGVNLNRQKYGPLDISNVFTSAADLKYYLTKGTFTEGVSEYWYKDKDNKVVPYPYEGQVLATVIDGVVSVYALSLDAEGNFQTQEIGAKVEVDGTTIVKDAEGKLSIVAPVDPASDKTYNFAYANGVYSWVEVDTATAAGQAQEINSLKSRTSALEDTLNGTAETDGLVKKVADNAEAIGKAATETDDATGLYAAIEAAEARAKAYADANDADTKYDDTALADRVTTLETASATHALKTDVEAVDAKLANYVKTADYDIDKAANAEAFADRYTKEEADSKFALIADAYDDSELVNRVATIEADYLVSTDKTELAGLVNSEKTRAEGIEAGLRSDVDTIKADYLKATDKEALQAQINLILDNPDAENAINSINEFTKYVQDHGSIAEGLRTDIDTANADIAAINDMTSGILAQAKDYADGLADNYATTEHNHVAEEITDFADAVATKVETYGYATTSYVDGKVSDVTADLNAAKAELSAEIDADVKVVADSLDAYKSTNNSAIAEVKATADAAAVKADVEEALANKVDSTTLEDYSTKAEIAEVYATKQALADHAATAENTYAKAANIEAELAKKIETVTISHTTADKSEGVTKNGTQLDIVVDAYTKQEVRDYVADAIQTMTGGESAADVKLLLENHVATYEEKVGQIDAKDALQDTAIASAKAQADLGVENAGKVASDLAALDARVVTNTNEIAAVAGTISTVNGTLSGEIAELKAKDIELAGLISGLDTTVKGHSETLGQHTAAITALENKDAELLAAIQSNTTKFNDYYTSAQVDAKVKAVADDLAKIDLTPFAKDAEVKAALDLKANVADVYTKDEADLAFMTETEVADKINALINAADPEGGKTIENIQNLVKYVDENAGEIAALVSTVSGHTTSIQKNADDIAAINLALTDIIQPKASDEVTVAEDGTLGIGEVNVNKLTQTNGDTLILNGGNAAE